MNKRPTKNLRERVVLAAERVLKKNGAVGPLELLEHVGFLASSHVQQWKQGNQHYTSLEPHIQCGKEKLDKTYQTFLAWVAEQKLEPFEATYTKASRSGAKPLQISTEGDPESEAFFRTQFRSADLSEAKKQRLEKKINKAPDLVVYQLSSKSANCDECETELRQGELVFIENSEPLCLQCADLAHLEFLPSGSAAMTRRAKKLSPLSAIVMRFQRSRKRYQRQGILVASAAIDAAEEQCAADADQRALRRQRDAVRREKQDVVLIEEMTNLILAEFPGCPLDEANTIAAHTAERGSGRVGRSAAGRDLQTEAISLAVGAWIRHQHTNYDELLMNGTDRQHARQIIRDQQQQVMYQWRAAQ